MNDGFDIPIVIFFFNRPDLIVQIVDRIASIKPKKMYLFCDGGRNDAEWKIVNETRKQVETRITWDCEVIKNYAEENRGVYESIGKGASWVFEREKEAIFLEDDNLPEVTFFEFCKEMLERYKSDRRILWICGTNYLENYVPKDGSSYMFTKHLMPCGWASWSDKFLAMYDGDLENLELPSMSKNLKFAYENKALYKQQLYAIEKTKDSLVNDKSVSWDYQMCFSIRINSVYGISPKYNQITNIGVDERSTHGGSSMRKIMTKRFCGIKSYPLEFPLTHPKIIMQDAEFEKRTCKIILMPFGRRVLLKFIRLIKPMLGFDKYESVSIATLISKIKKK